MGRWTSAPLRFHTRHTLPCNLSRIRSYSRPQEISPASPVARPDPFALLAPQLSELRQSLLSLLDSGHPHLSHISRYYFLHPSKQIRPLIILLFSRATNGLGRKWDQKLWEAKRDGEDGLDRPLSRPDVLNDWNPSLPMVTARVTQSFSVRPVVPHRLGGMPLHERREEDKRAERKLFSRTYVLPTQTRLAQIVEMMHTASLLHDDVIDESALRRGSLSAPAAFGSKMSVLGGNFVLGRASGALARLGDGEVTDLIASVLSNLVEGEILQMKEVKMGGEGHVDRCREAWNVYLQKTYLKTASLMAKGARAAVTLGGCKEGDVWREIAYGYGRNLGIAFQVRVFVDRQGSCSWFSAGG